MLFFVFQTRRGKSNTGYQNMLSTHVRGLLHTLKGYLLYFKPEGEGNRTLVIRICYRHMFEAYSASIKGISCISNQKEGNREALEAPLEKHWRSIGGALEDHWRSTGGVREEHWIGIGGAREEHWIGIGGALEEHWRSIGTNR